MTHLIRIYLIQLNDNTNTSEGNEIINYHKSDAITQMKRSFSYFFGLFYSSNL